MERLVEEPYAFDFFQAVRLLERMALERARTRAGTTEIYVGEDQFDHEAVRFRSQPSLSFPSSPIVRIRPADADEKTETLAEMAVTFMGTTGPIGVLPFHYTALLLRRVRDKDFSLRDFLDMFHHRAISFFFRAWIKYRLPYSYERSRETAHQRDDPITWAIYCLAGMGTDGLRGRLEIDDEAFLFYSGHFAHFPRSAAALQQILGDYFGLPIEVLQMHGQWLQLPESEQAVMPGAANPNGLNNALGVSLIVGERVWDVQSKFRLKVGPLTYAQFQQFLPGGPALRSICQLTRSYVGPEFDFDVQLVLRPEEVPASRSGGRQTRLGWDSWARTREFSRFAEDAVFSLDDI
jgi:type VI secretion system protein ImpH